MLIGLENDNIMYSNGGIYKIDNGGALRWRAQGKGKWTSDNDAADAEKEIYGLRNPVLNESAAAIYGSINDYEAAKQIDDLYSKKEDIMKYLDDIAYSCGYSKEEYVEVRNIIEKRLEAMKKWANSINK